MEAWLVRLAEFAARECQRAGPSNLLKTRLNLRVLNAFNVSIIKLMQPDLE